jgi:hypothetical protein
MTVGAAAQLASTMLTSTKSLKGRSVKRVFKYPLQGKGIVSVEIPFGGEILSLQLQDNIPVLWVLVDDSALGILEGRHFVGYQTGYPIDVKDRNLKYVGTVQVIDQSTPGGAFGLHVFEIINPVIEVQREDVIAADERKPG